MSRTPLGANGEIRLTAAIQLLLAQQPIRAYAMKEKSHDCGSKLGFLKANMEYGLRHPELKEQFPTYLKHLCKSL